MEERLMVEGLEMEVTQTDSFGMVLHAISAADIATLVQTPVSRGWRVRSLLMRGDASLSRGGRQVRRLTDERIAERNARHRLEESLDDAQVTYLRRHICLCSCYGLSGVHVALRIE